MTKVQTVKHPKSQYRRTVNASVVGSVKKAHGVIADCQLPIADCVFGFRILVKPLRCYLVSSVFIKMTINILFNGQLAIGNRQLSNLQSVASELHSFRQTLRIAFVFDVVCHVREEGSPGF
jgi:hypothetical protein